MDSLQDELRYPAGFWVGARTLGGHLVLRVENVEFVPNLFDRHSRHEYNVATSDVASLATTKRIAPYFVRRLAISQTDGSTQYFQMRSLDRRLEEIARWAEEHRLNWLVETKSAR